MIFLWLRGGGYCSLSTRMKKLLLPLFALLASAAAVFPQTVVAPGATLQKLAGDFGFTEGPTCDKNGNLFFVDQNNDSIMEWSADGKLSTFMKPSQYANGMMFDANGNLIACADEHNQLWSIATDKTVTVLITNYDGKYLNGPNDVWIAPNGAMYVTDPFYKRTWWDHTTMAQDSQEVYYFSPDRKNLVRVTGDLKQPNGITGTPDGKNLFVSDIRAGQTWRYDIQPEGSLTNKTLICKLGSDGMTIDADGNLYLTGHGVTVFDKTGKQIDHIDVPESWTANVCFGGKDHQTLFITASKSLYSIQLKTKGANAAK
jgi:gluconolactonase